MSKSFIVLLFDLDILTGDLQMFRSMMQSDNPDIAGYATEMHASTLTQYESTLSRLKRIVKGWSKQYKAMQLEKIRAEYPPMAELFCKLFE